MTSPYSGASSTGARPGDTQGIPTVGYQEPDPNYAVPPESYGAHSGTMGTPLTDQGRPDVEGTSVGQLLGEVSKDLSTLMRQELELAKAELKVEAKKAGQGAGMFG